MARDVDDDAVNVVWRRNMTWCNGIIIPSCWHTKQQACAGAHRPPFNGRDTISPGKSLTPKRAPIKVVLYTRSRPDNNNRRNVYPVDITVLLAQDPLVTVIGGIRQQAGSQDRSLLPYASSATTKIVRWLRPRLLRVAFIYAVGCRDLYGWAASPSRVSIWNNMPVADAERRRWTSRRAASLLALRAVSRAVHCVAGVLAYNGHCSVRSNISPASYLSTWTRRHDRVADHPRAVI